jgi:hypothetical protein
VSAVVISGGNITATGTNGAGIGTGYAFNGTSSVSSISITGGTITAAALDRGAGIGTGSTIAMIGSSSITDLTIAGGVVNATGHNGAGIGSGYAGDSALTDIDTLTISGGIVNAIADIGAGIGSGYANRGGSTVWFLNIMNAKITAEGSYGAGIGSGCGRDGMTALVYDAVILNGSIDARGSFGAGIGSGFGQDGGFSSVPTLQIFNGDIEATALANGAGIGSGRAEDSGKSIVVNLTITGGTITANGESGAGIGAASAAGAGNSTVSDLTILGGTFRASAVNGAGIGSGIASGENTASLVSNVLIADGSFTLSAVSGVGYGPSRTQDSGLRNLVIQNGVFDCSAVNSAPCFDADSVTFGTGVTTAVTGSTTVGSPGWDVSGSPELYFEYLGGSTQEQTTAIALIHLGGVSLPGSGVYVLTVSQVEGPNPGFSRVVEFNNARSRDCAFSVPSPGQYEIAFKSVSGSADGLMGHDGLATFAVSALTDNFYAPITAFNPVPSLPFTVSGFLARGAPHLLVKTLCFVWLAQWDF